MIKFSPDKDDEIQNLLVEAREIFSGQQRVTATFTLKDGQTLYVRRTTKAEPKLQNFCDALSLSPSPVGTRKLVS